MNQTAVRAQAPSDYPYYRHTWNRIVATLMAAAFIPLLIVGGGLYLFATQVAERTRQVHIIALLVFVGAGLLIVAAVLLTTNALVSRLEANRRSLGVLDRQLRRTSYLSASMELSLSYFQEIKETLVNIDSAAAVIQEDPQVRAFGQLLEDIQQIRSEVQRGRISVERLVRYIQGEPPLIRDVNLHELLDDLLEILGREFAFRNIRIQREYQHDLPPVRSDRSKLRQVFQNIVLNAMSAMEKEGQLSLSTALTADQVIVVIGDSGPGISEQDLPHIFEPLWTTKAQGTGLGLPICRDILERLGGAIEVDSRVGRGTTVSLTLPVGFGPAASRRA
jgi:two-component system, NtrC family, sensor kinase